MVHGLRRICEDYISECNLNDTNANEEIYELCFDYFLRDLTNSEVSKLKNFFKL